MLQILIEKEKTKISIISLQLNFQHEIFIDATSHQD